MSKPPADAATYIDAAIERVTDILSSVPSKELLQELTDILENAKRRSTEHNVDSAPWQRAVDRLVEIIRRSKEREYTDLLHILGRPPSLRKRTGSGAGFQVPAASKPVPKPATSKALEKLTQSAFQNIISGAKVSPEAAGMLSEEAKNLDERSRSVYAILNERATEAALPPPPAGPGSALLSLLKNVFAGGRVFEDADPLEVALYELIWRLAPHQQQEFLTLYDLKMFGAGNSNRLQPDDADVLTKWLIELFLQTNKFELDTGFLSFTTRYLNPTILSPYGQRFLLEFVENIFEEGATHAGGVSTDMILRNPLMDKINDLNTKIVTAYENHQKLASSQSGTRTQLAHDPFEPFSPAPQSSSSSAAALPQPAQSSSSSTAALPQPAQSSSSSAAALPQPAQSSSSSAAALPEALDTIRISAKTLGLIKNQMRYDVEFDLPVGMLIRVIYQTKLQKHLPVWLKHATTVPASVDDLSEKTRIDKVHRDREKFEALKKELEKQIEIQQKSKRLVITERAVKKLKADLISIDRQFIGMYSGRADLLFHLIAELTGPRPRNDWSNHLLLHGEPGTGKTSIALRLRSLMATLGLIEIPTLRTYLEISGSFINSLSEVEYRAIFEQSTIISSVTKKALVDQIGNDTYMALAASRYKRVTATDDSIYRPSDFESTYTGGQTQRFGLAILRTLGDIMVIDEAYGLTDQPAVVNMLNETISRVGLQWGTMLMGYTDRMKKLLDVNEGLSRRYQTTLTLDPYTTLEMTAIIIRKILASDNAVLARSEEAMKQLVDLKDGWEVDADTQFTAVWAAVAPYALRPDLMQSGPYDSNNLFGVANAGGAEEAFVAIAVDNETSNNSDVRFITPDAIASVLQRRKEANRPFGGWPQKEDNARPSQSRIKTVSRQ